MTEEAERQKQKKRKKQTRQVATSVQTGGSRVPGRSRNDDSVERRSRRSWSGSPPHTRRYPAPQAADDFNGRVVVHGSRREEHRSLDVDHRTTTPVIGDSNLRRVSGVPGHWCVHVLPGARRADVADLLNTMRISSPSKLRRVFVQVGVNDRNDRPPVRLSTRYDRRGENTH